VILTRLRTIGERRLLSEARALVPRIVDAEPATFSGDPREWAITHAELTSTGVAVAVLASPGRPACAVIKIPMRAGALPGMHAESRALAALHADDRIGDWRRLMPRPRATGTLHGRRYRVESALPGRVVLDHVRDRAEMSRLVDAAAETIHELHRRTTAAVNADDLLVERWIDGHVRDLTAHSHFPARVVAQLRGVQAELHAAVNGRAFSVATVHGDYWLGNVLFSGGRPSGVVDWDASGSGELPAIDVLHLLLYTRRLVSGQELGRIVSDQLFGGAWTQQERRLLAAHGWRGDGSLPDRAALLLYWLRHVAHHARQEPSLTVIGDRLWERRNVRRVLASA
jgi:aminoglycoside phosphotransferase (APT) family kinase protein